MPLLDELNAQLFTRPPVPTADFSGKTVVVTGANVGLGKEAVKHFVRLKSKKVTMAVRSVSKGEAAKSDIEREAQLPAGVIEVWKLDYASYPSCKNFAANAKLLDRIDAVVLNAGITTEQFEMLEDNESQVTVNVVSTTLLALLLLPTLRAPAAKYPQIVPVITIVGSGAHAYTKFPERNSPNSFTTLNDSRTARMSDRYLATKLLSLFAVREIAEKTADTKSFVIVNTVNPGLCYLNRNLLGATSYAMRMMKALTAWTAEKGSRTLVYATVAGPHSHGVYISGSKIPKRQSKFVTSPGGRKAQKKVWAELADKLENIKPGVTREL